MADKKDAPKQADKKDAPKLVRMVRDAEAYPEGPHEAEVHAQEVENFRAGGWQEA